MSATKMADRLAAILKRHGDLIAAVFFDVDGGQDLKRQHPTEPYALAVHLLYSTTFDPEAAELAAGEAKAAIEAAFHERCFSEEKGMWLNIELLECLIVSDQAMTYADALVLRKWNADYISLRAEPQQPVVE